MYNLRFCCNSVNRKEIEINCHTLPVQKKKTFKTWHKNTQNKQEDRAGPADQ